MISAHLIGLIASYTYATSLLAIATLLKKFFQVSPEITRKLIHIGAGMWIFGVLALFENWQIGIIPFATFIPLNYLFYRYRILDAMDTTLVTLVSATVATLAEAISPHGTDNLTVPLTTAMVMGLMILIWH